MSDEPVMREVDLEPVTWYFGEHIRVTRAVPAAGLPVVGARLLVTVYVPGDKDRSIVVPADDIINWVAAGKLQAVRTLGGHLRFDPAAVEQLLHDQRH